MAFVETWDESKPAGSRAVSLGDDDIREFKRAIRERLAEDHRFYASETGETIVGGHDKVTLGEVAADPTQVANAIILYSKLTGSYAELYSRHENEALQQLTRNGQLWIAALDVASEARGDIITRGASVWGRLGIGTANHVLKSDGTDPAYGTLHGVILKTAGDFSTTLSVTDPTAARTLTIPDASVTVFPWTTPAAVTNATDVTSSTGTYADVASLTITFTSTGGVYVATFSGLMDNNIDGSYGVTAIRDGDNNVLAQHWVRSSGPHGVSFTAVGVAAAGSFTVKASIKADKQSGAQNDATLKGTVLASTLKVVHQ